MWSSISAVKERYFASGGRADEISFQEFALLICTILQNFLILRHVPDTWYLSKKFSLTTMMIGGVVSINGEGEDVASEGSWQKNLLLAKQYINLDNSMSDASGTDEVFELFGIDNTSHRCSGYLKAMEDGFYVACPDDKPLWWLVLRWLKMMLLKIVRTYHGKPFLLVVAPLLIGLCIGYLIGRQSQQRSSWLSQILERPRDWISLAHFQLREFLGEKSTPTKKYAIRSVERSNSIGALQASPRELTSREADKLLERREELVRKNLQSETGTRRESGVDVVKVPKHVAVIMDGNRRYGKAKYGSAVKGHWDGSSKLVEFAKWCIAEKVAILTVYAFSTENWNRDAGEVASLMSIFAKYCDELRIEALERNIKISVLSTDFARVSKDFWKGLKCVAPLTVAIYHHLDPVTYPGRCQTHGRRYTALQWTTNEYLHELR